MKIKEITVTYGVTVSYTKYRFIRLEYSMGAELYEHENVTDSINALRETLRTKVAKDAKAEVKAWRKLGAQVEATDGPDDFDFN